MLERSKPLQIYMKPGIKEDDLLLRVWEACRRHDRPQDVFRSMLRAGLMVMVESGEMPEAVIEECALENLLERRRRRSRKPQEAQPQQPAYAPPPYGYPMPVPQHYPAAPVHPAPWPQQLPQGHTQVHPQPEPQAPVRPLEVREPRREELRAAQPDAARPAAEPEERKASPSDGISNDGKPRKRIGPLM